MQTDFINDSQDQVQDCQSYLKLVGRKAYDKTDGDGVITKHEHIFLFPILNKTEGRLDSRFAEPAVWPPRHLLLLSC